jgi:cell wall-associated NlpC family hydrolase
LRITFQSRLALLALLCGAVFVLAARHASAAPGRAKSVTRTAVTGKRAVHFARRLLGVPYSYGGTSPRSGFDCSGFVRYVFEHFGIDLPHSSYAQFGTGRRVARGGLLPGDLVFFDGRGHVGVYVGRGRFIHAPHSGTRVSIDPLDGWYGARYDGARRLVRAV